MSIGAKHQFVPGQYHNYVIAGNVCNTFALGDVGSSEDFFLVSGEPVEESHYPLLTGTILDAEGHVVCRLARNVLVANPGHCSRIFANQIGYDIHDGNNHRIFRVRTVFARLPGVEDEYIDRTVKCAFGFSRVFGFAQGMHEQELQVLRSVLQTRGAVHELVTGALDGQEIVLDGKALINAQITNCVVHVKTGAFAALGNVNFDHCRILFHDAADNIRNLVLALQGQSSGESSVANHRKQES
jgi:hypothetical protein